VLNIEGINVYYGESHVLRDVHLEIPSGKVLCLLGRNGVGKTTLLKSIMGLLPLKTGRIVYNDETISSIPTNLRAKRGIGYAPQGREIFPKLSVLENLRLGLEATDGKETEIPTEVFDLFPALKTMLDRQGGILSGGQQQQLAIGRALVSRPKLLLLDEPTEGIQPSIISEIENVIGRLKEMGTVSILLVEQYLAFARRLGDFYSIMAKGAIVSQGKIDELDSAMVKKHLVI